MSIMKIVIKLIILFFFILASKLHAETRLANLSCYNKSKSNLMEFQFKKENTKIIINPKKINAYNKIF